MSILFDSLLKLAFIWFILKLLIFSISFYSFSNLSTLTDSPMIASNIFNLFLKLAFSFSISCLMRTYSFESFYVTLTSSSFIFHYCIEFIDRLVYFNEIIFWVDDFIFSVYWSLYENKKSSSLWYVCFCRSWEGFVMTFDIVLEEVKF